MRKTLWKNEAKQTPQGRSPRVCATERTSKTSCTGEATIKGKSTYRLFMFFNTGFQCWDAALGIIIQAIEVLLPDNGQVCPGIQFSRPDVMPPEHGCRRHRESGPQSEKSRPLQSRIFATLNGIIVATQAIDGTMICMAGLMDFASWWCDFDASVGLYIARPERFLSMLSLWGGSWAGAMRTRMRVR